MEKYNGRFKVSFIGEPRFHINEKKKTVSCILDCQVRTPFVSLPHWLDSSEPYVYGKDLTGFGIARCCDEDVFDENRGKRIALARAENDCYNKATSYLMTQANLLGELINGIDEFTDKEFDCCSHNDDYVDSLTMKDHPFYKNDVSSPKRGVVITKR